MPRAAKRQYGWSLEPFRPSAKLRVEIAQVEPVRVRMRGAKLRLATTILPSSIATCIVNRSAATHGTDELIVWMTVPARLRTSNTPALNSSSRASSVPTP